MANVSTNIKVDAALKKEAQELFSALGMDMTTAVNIFLRQAVREQGIPFHVTRIVPNQEDCCRRDKYGQNGFPQKCPANPEIIPVLAWPIGIHPRMHKKAFPQVSI